LVRGTRTNFLSPLTGPRLKQRQKEEYFIDPVQQTFKQATRFFATVNRQISKISFCIFIYFLP